MNEQMEYSPPKWTFFCPNKLCAVTVGGDTPAVPLMAEHSLSGYPQSGRCPASGMRALQYEKSKKLIKED